MKNAWVGTRKENWNDAHSLTTCAIVQGGSHLFIFPRADAAGPEEDGVSSALFQSLLKALLPWLSGDQMPLVKKGTDFHLLQAACQCFDGQLVSAVVAQEDII